MSTVGIRELKQNASAVVARAVAGESVTITDRGRPVAQLTGLQVRGLEAMRQAGQSRAALRPFSELLPPAEGEPLSQALIAARDDERF